MLSQLAPSLAGQAVLDLGCGDGRHAGLLSQRGARVVGVDVSREMISLAHQEPRNARSTVFAVECGASLAHRDATFDVVFTRMVLHYIPSVPDTVTEIARVLRRGGILVASVEHPVSDFARAGRNDYHRQQSVRRDVYGGRLTLEFLSHRLSDYWTRAFLAAFRLVAITEDPGVTTSSGATVPHFLGFCAERI